MTLSSFSPPPCIVATRQNDFLRKEHVFLIWATENCETAGRVPSQKLTRETTGSICCAPAMRNSNPRSRHDSSFSPSPIFPQLSLPFAAFTPLSSLCYDRSIAALISRHPCFTSAGSISVMGHFLPHPMRDTGVLIGKRFLCSTFNFYEPLPETQSTLFWFTGIEICSSFDMQREW